MATFAAIVNNTTYNLNDGAPFRMVSLSGGGNTSVQRYGQRSPLQNGVVDAGFGLGFREVELSLLFFAGSDATLDTYRQQLATIFCPTPDIPIYLRVTRDDGSIRQLETYTTGSVNIVLIPEERAAHLHRATVRLRAHRNLWRAPTQTTGALTGPGVPTEWWLAGGAIGSANVLEHVEYPTQGQAWSFAGTHNFYTIVFRTASDENTQGRTAFRHGTANNVTDPKLWRLANSWSITDSETSVSDLPSGERNYFYYADLISGDRILLYDADIALDSYNGIYQALTQQGAWRGDLTGAGSALWSPEFPAAAIYNTSLSSSQRNALSTYMTQTSTLGTANIVNSGDIAAYPRITLIGPIVNPRLTNVTTGQVINLDGLTLGSAEACFIDLSTGNKTITNAAGSSLLSYMGTPAQLANFYLAPSPIATGGTNSIQVGGGSTTATTHIEFQHYNQYMSF